MKRIPTLLFAVLAFSLTVSAQTSFELDSLKYIEELQLKKIPQLIEVRVDSDAVLYPSPIDTATTVRITKMAGMPLFLLGDEGGYWACCYFGRIAYVLKSAVMNSAAIQRAYDDASHHYRYLLAYNAVVQGLRLALEYTEQAQTAMGDNSIDEEPTLKTFLESKHRNLPEALPYLDKMDPKAFFGR